MINIYTIVINFKGVKMLKLYKNNSKEGKNEIIMQTDCNTSSELTLELTLAFMDYFTSTEEVTTQDIEQILEKFLLVSLKLLGYKSEKVYEYRLSTCGYSSPEGCSLICETGNLHLDSYEKSAQFLIQKAKEEELNDHEKEELKNLLSSNGEDIKKKAIRN